MRIIDYLLSLDPVALVLAIDVGTDDVGLLLRLVPIVLVVIFAVSRLHRQRWRRRPLLVIVALVLATISVVLRLANLPEWTPVPGLLAVGLLCAILVRYMADEVRDPVLTRR